MQGCFHALLLVAFKLGNRVYRLMNGDTLIRLVDDKCAELMLPVS
jgi:hypothetical protein